MKLVFDWEERDYEDEGLSLKEREYQNYIPRYLYNLPPCRRRWFRFSTFAMFYTQPSRSCSMFSFSSTRFSFLVGFIFIGLAVWTGTIDQHGITACKKCCRSRRRRRRSLFFVQLFSRIKKDDVGAVYMYIVEIITNKK